MKPNVKKLSDTFLYGVGEYEKNLYKYFVSSTVIDKKDLEEVRFDIKRGQNTNVILNVFDSENVVFLTNTTAQPRSLKVFAASDIKSGDKRTKIFIDTKDVIFLNNGRYEIKPRDLDKLVSYLMSAFAYLLYYADPIRITGNTKLLETGTSAFANLFTFCIDSLRIGGVDKIREKCLYMSSIYYQTCILGKDITDSAETRAKKISGLNDREIERLDMLLDSNTYNNINTFIMSLSKAIKADTLNIDNFIEKWLFVYGSGTQFATELFPAFSTMITNAYCGAYLNNQKGIEKVIGRTLVEYTSGILKIGGELK